MFKLDNTPQRKNAGAKGGNQYGAYQVRHASQRQVSFIKTLLQQKQHDLVVDFENLNVQGAGDLITKLLALPLRDDYVAMPTERQLSFAQSLIKNRVGGMELYNQVLQNHGVNSLEQLTKSVVSGIINTLKDSDEISLAITEVGAYLLNETIYSIRLGKESGKLQVYSYSPYAEKYLRNDVSKEKEILRQLQPTDRLTLEQAIKYSAQTGSCVHCGRTLTLRKSVAAGMGQVCASKYH